jgi:HK97 family phage major capsid protein
VSFLTNGFGYAIGQEIDNQVFNGTGSPFVGLIANAYYSHSVTTSGVDFGFTDDDFSTIIYKISKRARSRNAKFYIPTPAMAYVQNVDDTAGNRLFRLDGSGIGRILGYEVVEVPALPDDVAVSTGFGIFGDLAYYNIGMRQGISALEADPFGLFTYDQTRFRIKTRLDGALGLSKAFVVIKSHA